MQILLAVLGGIAVLVVVALALSLRIVQQYQEGVLFRLGRVVGLPASSNGFPGER